MSEVVSVSAHLSKIRTEKINRVVCNNIWLPLHVEEITFPFRIVIWDEDMKWSKQYGPLLSIQKFCKLLLLPTSSGLRLIDRLVIQTASSLVLCNWNSSLVTSTASIFKQYSNSLKPAGIVAIVWPLCLIIISLPAQYFGPVPPGNKGCWHSNSSSLDLARMQKFSVLSFPWKKDMSNIKVFSK